jgi:hypothetical protein
VLRTQLIEKTGMHWFRREVVDSHVALRVKPVALVSLAGETDSNRRQNTIANDYSYAMAA